MMKRINKKGRSILTVLFSLIIMGTASCQVEGTDSVATFPGGKEQLDNYLYEHMDWRQSQLTVEGKVYVSFIVKKNGSITDVKVTKGLCDTCNEEAIRLVKNMPNWQPARKEGKNVESKVIIPITFKSHLIED